MSVQTVPTLDQIQSLDGREFAMLSDAERATFAFYRDQGRKFDVSVAVLSDADPKALEQVGRLQADEIMRRANSRVRITIGNDAQAAWAARAN
jgi:hypothetical protein